MNPRLVCVLLGCALAISGGRLEAAPSKPAPEASVKEEPGAEKSAKPAIRKGMTSDEVIALIGKPNQVKQIAVGDAKGESWIYRRVAKRTMNQTAATVDSVPVYGGLGMSGDGIVNINVPSQRLERITIYQMTALLMFDGKLVATRQWFEQERHFD